MKQQQITIGNKTILVVDLPEGANILWIENNLIRTDKISNSSHNITLPKGNNWQLIGFVSEEVAVKVGFTGQTKFKHSGDAVSVPPLEQLTSELQSNGILTVNPYGEKPTCNAMCGTEFSGCDGKSCQLLQWQTAQSQLWVNPVILVKKDE